MAWGGEAEDSARAQAALGRDNTHFLRLNGVNRADVV